MELIDYLFKRIAHDEPHGVVRAAVGVGAQAIDRNDPRVLEPAGDLGLLEEPLAAHRVIGVGVEDLLERNLAIQLAVERHEDSPEPALGVRAQEAKPLAAGGRCAAGGGSRPDGVAQSAIAIDGLGRQVRRAGLADHRRELRIAERGHTLAD